jgi:putative endopeptidase
MKRRLIVLASLLCAGCMSSQPPAPPAPPPAPPAPQAAIGKWGFDLADMDTSVKPGDDFFEYVNGQWLKTAVIPPDRASTGSFQDLRIQSEERLKSIVATLEKTPADQLTPEERKLRDLYDAFEDRAQIDSRGLQPVQKDLDYLGHLKTKADVARAMGSVRLMTASIYDVGIGVDNKNPNAYSIDLSQSGLGLPNRDYYLDKKDKALAETRDAYKTYLAQMLTLAGYSHAGARAAKIYAVEAEIAEAEWPNEDRRDADKTYNPMTFSALKKLAPQFPWDSYFGETDIPLTSRHGERQVIVAEKSAFPKLAEIFAKTPVSVWRDYLIVHYLHSFAPFLPKKFDDANFDFYGKVIAGEKQQLDRPTRGVHLLDDNIGEALGKLYVAKYFPPEAKAKAEKLVHNLLLAYEADIKTLDWMTPATRAKALEKLHKLTPHIGYPDKWRDYSALSISRDDLVGDIQNASEFEWHRELKRLDGAVDKSEWFITPSTINAYYYSPFNEIIFTAAILQPPFFDPNADDAVNYGGIGAVIGHEISHGFDDQGSKYDGDGVLANWWTPEDRKNFEARTTALVKQYNTYEPLPGQHVNGAFTQGENIADLAGLSIALKAYHISLDDNPAPVLDGFTGDQRFFLSFGQIWRAKYRDNILRELVLSDPHSPVRFRADGVTRNIDAWYTDFDVKPGDKFYLPPDQRVHLW